MSLLLRFQGWFELRLATDPDPTDEPRGVSGYTFAFGDEPSLDRWLNFQPNGLRRTYQAGVVGSPGVVGVFVTQATRTEDGSAIDALIGASVNLVEDERNGRPRLENRNWTLTDPGFEPIVPFNVRIGAANLDITIERDDPLDPDHPDEPVWRVSADALARRGASGYNFDAYRVRRATEILDPLAVLQSRLGWLQSAPAAVTGCDPSIIAGRIAELEIAVSKPNDRRVQSRYGVEVFDFDMSRGDGGRLLRANGTTANPQDLKAELGGVLDLRADWHASFWLGGWDPDLLCGYTEGSFEVPYAS